MIVSLCCLMIVLFMSSCDSPVIEVEEYRPIIRSNPDEGDRFFNRGVALRLLSRRDEAKESFLKALEYDPADRDSWFRIGEIYLETNEIDLAKEAFINALTDGPVDMLHNKLAAAYYNIGWLADAEREYRLAINNDEPHPIRSLSYLGATLLRLKRFEEAIILLENAASLLPDDVASYHVYRNLGMAYHEIDHFEKAEDMYNLSLQYKPDNAFVLFNRAMLFIETARIDQACLECEKMRTINLPFAEQLQAAIDSANKNK